MSREVTAERHESSGKWAIVLAAASILVVISVIILDLAVVRPVGRKMRDLLDASIGVYEAALKDDLDEIRTASGKREEAESRLKPGEVATAVRVSEASRLAIWSALVLSLVCTFHTARLFATRSRPGVRFRLALTICAVALVCSLSSVAAFEIQAFLRKGSFYFPFMY